MAYSDVSKLVDRAENRLDEADEEPIETLDWFYGEIGSIARARDDVTLSKTTVILFLSSHFYEEIMEEAVKRKYKTRIKDNNTLISPDEEILFSFLIEQDLRELFEDNELNKGRFNQLLKEIMQEENLKLEPDRFANLSIELSSQLTNAFRQANNSIMSHDEYGLKEQFNRIRDESDKDNPDLVDVVLEILMDVHREVQNFPKKS